MENVWNEHTKALNRVLAKLYPNKEQARRIVSFARIPTDNISFADAAATNWFHIIEEAYKHDCLKALVKEALEDYPENPHLSKINQALFGKTVESRAPQPEKASKPTFKNRKELIAYAKAHCPEGMVFVEGGKFMMGAEEYDDEAIDSEKPRHEVQLDSFYMDQYAVTNEQFAQFLNAKGNQVEGGIEWINLSGAFRNVEVGIEYLDGHYWAKSGHENLPVIYVSWYAARAYADWKGKRLPTEAEWEYAGRGGKLSKGYIYAGSNNLVEVGNNNRQNLTAVGSFKANELGIFDMSGNVWEWCSDWYSNDYYEKCNKTGLAINPEGPEKGTYRVIRGGSWDDHARLCRVSFRSGNAPVPRRSPIGFRLAFSPVLKAEGGK